MIKRFSAMTFESKWYVPFVLAVWTFAPELRRVVDYNSNYHSLSLINFLPPISLIPGIFCLHRERMYLGSRFQTIANLWIAAFGYAFVVACLTRTFLPATYDVVQFCFPILFAVLQSTATKNEGIEAGYHRVASWYLTFAVISSLYGIYQFANPPAWDVFWAQQANIEGSQGVTESFGFRIFGTLNSTGPFAGYLVFAILLNLPRLRLSRWWLPLLMAPCLIALVLTEVRAAWLGLTVGIVIYLIFSPLRRRVLVPLAAASLALILLATALLSTVKGSETAFTTFTTRLSTFSQLDSDESATTRKEETVQGLHDAFAEPLGFGLGSTGLGTKLAGGPGGTIDNGYISRFLELGYFGFVIYLGAVMLALFSTVQVLRRYQRKANLEAANILAVAVSIQILMVALEFASDSHNGFAGMWFWYSIFLASAYAAPNGARLKLAERPEPLRVRLRANGSQIDEPAISGAS